MSIHESIRGLVIAGLVTTAGIIETKVVNDSHPALESNCGVNDSSILVTKISDNDIRIAVSIPIDQNLRGECKVVLYPGKPSDLFPSEISKAAVLPKPVVVSSK